MSEKPSVSYYPFILGITAFLLLLGVTQYLAYQRYQLTKKTERDALKHELDETKSRLKDILVHNISSANTIAIIYKQQRQFNDFDGVCKQILEYDNTIDFINFAEKYTITHVYPLQGNQMILGHSLLDVPLFRKEIETSIKNKTILFAGPYKLTSNRGTGIACRLPVFINNEYVGLASVVTKLPTIFKRLPQLKNEDKKIVYQLAKEHPVTHKTEFFLDNYLPRDNDSIKVYMPEGNWTLYASYSSAYPSSNDHYIISFLGLLLSLSISFFIYNRAKLPAQLEKTVQLKTLELRERVKELSTIFKLNELLSDDTGRITKEQKLKKIVMMLPSGWQYSEDCEARIHFDGQDYSTAGFVESPYRMIAHFELFDGRKGFVEVVYTKKKPLEAEGSFLKEERDLINTIAGTISIYFNKAAHQRILIESEAKFRGAFEHSAIGMALVGTDNRWLMVNHAICNILGYAESEMLTMATHEITHPEDLEKENILLNETLAGKRDYFRIEKRYYRKDGSVVWVNRNASLVRDQHSNPLYFVSQLENITERVESQRKFQDLVEKSLVGVYVIQDGKFAYVNPRIIIYSGYTEEQLAGMSLQAFIHPEDIATVQENMQARLTGLVESVRYEIRAIRSNGDIVWLEMFGTMTIYNGAPAIIGTMVNVNDRKNLELERQQIMQDLVQRNRDLEQFAHILSHNVRAPLSTILGLTNLIKDEQDKDEQQTIIDGIEYSAQQLDTVVTDLNQILHIKRDLSEIKTNINLNDVLTEVKNILKEHIKNNKVVIEVDFSSAPNLYSVRSYINSIFYNLISNAIKYARKDSAPHILIRSAEKDGMIYLSFKDNGLGIDMDRNGEHLFGLYKRFNPEIEGRGLGLFMVKTQVDALKGLISVKSTVGSGTEFIISIEQEYL